MVTGMPRVHAFERKWILSEAQALYERRMALQYSSDNLAADLLFWDHVRWFAESVQKRYRFLKHVPGLPPVLAMIGAEFPLVFVDFCFHVVDVVCELGSWLLSHPRKRDPLRAWLEYVREDAQSRAYVLSKSPPRADPSQESSRQGRVNNAMNHFMSTELFYYVYLLLRYPAGFVVVYKAARTVTKAFR